MDPVHVHVQHVLLARQQAYHELVSARGGMLQCRVHFCCLLLHHRYKSQQGGACARGAAAP
eukprot:scaffold14118_cov18-Tisochrysis_lutea.AAC.2